MAPPKALSVAVRCRMILPHDRDQRVSVRAVGSCDIECLDPDRLHPELREIQGRPDYLKENHNRERAYTFDSVFGAEATNSSLFEALTAPLLPEVLSGKHATIFAYGQTGSGKTHTMLGRQGEPGLVELTLQRLLDAQQLPETSVTITFVEVYNEKIRDLLHPKCHVLELRDDRWRGPCIVGVSEVVASTACNVMELVRVGNARRTEETTAANPVSSRSHAVLQVVFETQLADVGGAARRKRVSKLSLIDLAGSERAANTGNRGARLREGAMINRSLLALANCITALTRKGAYVNYRDSKLTRLLKDSFSGNCFTTMIAHVSPSIASFEETVNTLKYAHRACEIRGMVGGVRENICEVELQYADRLRPCLQATVGLKHAVEKLAVPRPIPRRPAARPSVAPPNSLAGNKSRAIELADELERTRQKVVGKMRERIRIEQTVLELDDQNARNSIELSQIELDAVLGTVPEEPQAPGEEATKVTTGVLAQPQLKLLKKHGALRAATRNNDAQRRRAEHQSERAEQREGENEARLVSLLADARNVIEDSANSKDVGDVEKRLLHAQHAISLLEIEKIEAEQNRVVLEAASRKHELALRKQKIQVDVHAKALVVAEALLAKHGLLSDWRANLGPLADLLPASDKENAPPSLDALIAEISAPGTPFGSRPPTSCALAALDPSPPPAADAADAIIRDIDGGFDEMRVTLARSLKRATPAHAAATAHTAAGDPGELMMRDIDEEFDEMRATLGRSLQLPAPASDEGDEYEENIASMLSDEDDEDEEENEEVDAGVAGNSAGAPLEGMGMASAIFSADRPIDPGG